MAAEYIETQIDPSDTKSEILETLAGGHPWVFLVAKFEGDDLDMSAETGGGIRDARTVRKMLTLTLDALPEEA